MTLAQWKALSPAEQEEERESWDPYGPGYWHELNEAVVQAFREHFVGEPAIIEVVGGTYHGGTLIVGVSTTCPWNEPLDLPDEFLGFPVLHFGRPT